MVNYDIQSGFFVTSIPFVSNNVSTTKLYQPASTSILSIKEVHLKNAGNYTCAPPNAKPSSIMVHVLRGMCFFFISFSFKKKMYCSTNPSKFKNCFRFSYFPYRSFSSFI